ncbi:exonuclease 1 isoform X1 [Hemibagrus wyckioides]|uniref:exonuclease 1 isoform X1 n=1 Tax=Hemibagrus wyckioides TaxID=337641 RepID=UPI00266CE4B3|nr:exonuclease 1 isoform X1 [Hemibagrus wyckioides]
MGIQGLLQFLKEASEPVHVQKYRGHTVAVDTYCWLHKGAFSCAEKLAKGEPTDQYVVYCMKLVDMLLSYGIKPVLVFDGRNLPSKQEVEKARRERRQANLQKGKQLLREGKVAEARDCFTRCVNVTPSMAHQVIKAARARGVDCLVAPYEADAQLAFLNKSGIAQAIITEDSDLLAFGCKKVILKMDKQGNGLEISQCHLGRCRSLGDVFTEEKFRYMCILSGCDYLPSLYGIGLGKACKLLRMANNPDILTVIRKLGQYLKMNINVPDEYIDGFVKANNTFLYQLVFDPIERKVVPLNPYPENLDLSTLSYAGVNVGDKQGLQMALGNVDINTMERIDYFNPDAPVTQPVKAPRSRGWSDAPVTTSRQVSIWSKAYVPGSVQPQTPSSPQRPAQTRGKGTVMSLRGLKLPNREPQVKRPRQDSAVSDEDVLEQYSSDTKKQRTVTMETEHSVPKETKHSQREPPRPRNRFATLLQWRNQSEEGDGEQEGTRSRFFASSDVTLAESNRSKEESDDRTEPDHALMLAGETHSTQRETETSLQRASLSAFSWSGSSTEHFGTGSLSSDRPRTPSMPLGLSVLQQFQRKKENISWGQTESPQRSLPCSPPEGAVDGETPPGSPPSQDSAYFSQSCSSHSVSEDSTTGTHSATTSPETEKDPWRDLGCSETLSEVSVMDEVRSTPSRTKVSGLSRIRPSAHEKGSKIRPSAPARVSGLRKAQGKKMGVTNENNPGLQATISGLWKNFSFNKENPKLNNPCKKGEPMSPVKDNVQ